MNEQRYSDDAVWNLLDAAQHIVRRAHGLCADPDTERLDTALVLAAEDALLDAKRNRAAAVRRSAPKIGDGLFVASSAIGPQTECADLQEDRKRESV